MNIKDSYIILDISNKNIDKIIRKTRKIVNLCDKNNYKIKLKYTEDILNKEKLETLNNIKKAINIKDVKKRYSFIYDTVYDYIDNKYLTCNYCDFKNNVCVFFRNNPNIIHENGCCYSDARGGLCNHLKNNKCEIKSISCKLYSCEYLRKRKVNFRMKNIPLIKYFFNLKQKYFIKYSFFKPKSYVMYKLIENKGK